MSFTIEINDTEVTAALNRLLAAGQDLSPVLKAIGEGMVERTKQRFGTGTDPAGHPWAPNSPVTLARKPAGKKPLHGEAESLSTQIHYQVNANELVVGSTMIYAGVQQFGAIQGEFGRDKRNHPIPWGDILPRPFLPVTPMEDLYPDEQATILDELNQYLQDAIDG